MLKKSKSKPQTALLFRDALITLASAEGVDGSKWSFCAYLENYRWRTDPKGARHYVGFEYSFFLICPAANIKLLAAEPDFGYAYSSLVRFGRGPQIQFGPVTPVELRPATPTYNAIDAAGGEQLLTQLSLNAARTLNYLACRRALNDLKSEQSQYLDRYTTDPRMQIQPLPSQEEIDEQAVRNTAISWLKVRIELLTHPNRQVANLALGILTQEDESTDYEDSSPDVNDLLAAAKLALG